MNLRQSKTLAGDKRHWRTHFKALLQKESPHSSAQIQHHLCENLSQYLHNQTGIWAGYQALDQEPDLSPVFRHTPAIEWAYPRMEKDHLAFYITQNFVKGPFGILEPCDEAVRVESGELKGILVPGLGFNRKGRRLGKGKGFYDRALESYTGIKVGVCFHCQVVDEDLPEEGHDVGVDALITEKEIIICS